MIQIHTVSQKCALDLVQLKTKGLFYSIFCFFAVRALLVFDADTESTNEKNETPWQIAYAKATTDSSIMDSLQSRYIHTKKRGKCEIIIQVVLAKIS